MQVNTTLQRHYAAAKGAFGRAVTDRAADNEAYAVTLAGAIRARDTAALHVGLDTMSRIAAKRRPQAGCVASYPPIARDVCGACDAASTVLHGHWAELLRQLRERPADPGLGRAIAVAGHYALHC